MGEYAIYGGNQIKIGTCESMYYLRFEDRNKVTAQRGNVDPANDAGLRFRLPFPDEDGIEPGNYENYKRGELLRKGNDWYIADPVMGDDAGIIQLTHPSGLLVNVPCHHGAKLPAIEGAKVFWNGKSPSIELQAVKHMGDGETMAVIGCRHCGKQWRAEWAEIADYIPDETLRARVAQEVVA